MYTYMFQWGIEACILVSRTGTYLCLSVTTGVGPADHGAVDHFPDMTGTSTGVRPLGSELAVSALRLGRPARLYRRCQLSIKY